MFWSLEIIHYTVFPILKVGHYYGFSTAIWYILASLVFVPIVIWFNMIVPVVLMYLKDCVQSQSLA